MKENSNEKTYNAAALLLAVILACLWFTGCAGTNELQTETGGISESTAELSEAPTHPIVKRSVAKYYIKTVIDREMFEFSVYIPEDYRTKVTHFELWQDDQLIGQKTPVYSTLRHLALSNTGNKTYLLFYNGNEYICECLIDPTASEGVLNIEKEVSVTLYKIRIEKTINDVTGMMSIKLVDICGFEKFATGFELRTTEGTTVGNRVPIDGVVTHLSLVSQDDVRICILDGEELLGYCILSEADGDGYAPFYKP